MTNIHIALNKANIAKLPIEIKLKELFKGRPFEVLEANLFYFDHMSKRIFNVSSPKRFDIFVHATFEHYEEVDVIVQIDEASYAIKQYKPKYEEGVTPILQNGTEVAFYHKDRQSLYIPYNLEGLGNRIAASFITTILDLFNEQVLAQIANKNSWVKTDEREMLIERIKKNVNGDPERRKREAEQRVKDMQESVDYHIRELKNRYDRFEQAKKELAALMEDGEGLDDFLKELDLIAKHPGVTDVVIEQDFIKVHVSDVSAYVDVAGEERKFYIGNMRIDMNIRNTDIKFFGDNPRKSHWTSHDPHPHVDGDSGTACLGNVGASIAQLCSQKKAYALFLVCLDFLQNANTDDVAGKNIVNWDEIDEEGNIINEGGTLTTGNTFYCERCENDHDEEEVDSFLVYTEFRDGEVFESETWCEHCRSDYATYHEELGETIDDEIWSEVNDYFEPEEDEEEECEEEGAMF